MNTVNALVAAGQVRLNADGKKHADEIHASTKYKEAKGVVTWLSDDETYANVYWDSPVGCSSMWKTAHLETNFKLLSTKKEKQV